MSGVFAISRRALLGLFGVAASALLVQGCSEEKSGPEHIHWDRDSCELCRMLISDARFAAQIRGGEKRENFLFDDFGDAIHWLSVQPWKDDPAVEFWIADMHSTRDKPIWLEARSAWYVEGQVTPMDYGWGAVSGKTENTVSFEIMREKVMERGCSTRCLPEHQEAAGLPAEKDK
ncbi:MAG: nitrous oxide reductase accessory protein NosL [Rhodospirillales bacterium]|nr:nitrous oxide reductase accessory protein NosL [Rhodospirillales bacterium]